jgi:hypothetical protein
MPELDSHSKEVLRRAAIEPLLPVLEEVHQPQTRVQPLPPHKELPGSALRAHQWSSSARGVGGRQGNERLRAIYELIEALPLVPQPQRTAVHVDAHRRQGTT